MTMTRILLSIGFLCILQSASWAQQTCQSNFMDTSQMCLSGHTSGDSILMDFSPFESAGAPSCGCTVYVATGSQLEFNYVYSPGYYGCGSVITIVHRTTSTFRCLQGAESLPVTPGDSVTVQITREKDMFDSKYCYLLRAYQYSGLDRVPGSVIVVCSQPPQSSTTSTTTTDATTTALPHHNNTTISHALTTTLPRVTSNSNHELTSLPLTTSIGFTTALVTNSTTEVSPEYKDTTPEKPANEHSENRDLAHFPWEIITPLSIIIFILIVVAIIIFKVRRRRYLKSTYKPAETRTTSWAFNQPSLTVTSPKITQNVKPRIGKTDSGVYSTLGENDKRSTESVPSTVEKYYREVSIDDAIVESEARKQRNAQAQPQQKDEGLDNPGFEEDEIVENSSESRDISSSVASSQSDITKFISKICAADTENQKYFLDFSDKSVNGEDTSVKKSASETMSVNSYSVVTESDQLGSKTEEASSQLPIDTGYVVIDVMANI